MRNLIVKNENEIRFTMYSMFEEYKNESITVKFSLPKDIDKKKLYMSFKESQLDFFVDYIKVLAMHDMIYYIMMNKKEEKYEVWHEEYLKLEKSIHF